MKIQIIHVNTVQEFENAINNSKIVVFDFWADWCQPCKMFARVLDELMEADLEELKDVTVAKVDVENVDDDLKALIGGQFRISAIPTMFVFYKGGLVQFQMENGPTDRIIGALPKNAFLQVIQAVNSITEESTAA